MGLTELLALKDGFMLLSETVSPRLKGLFVCGSSVYDLLWGHFTPQRTHSTFIFKSVPGKFLIISGFYVCFFIDNLLKNVYFIFIYVVWVWPNKLLIRISHSVTSTFISFLLGPMFTVTINIHNQCRRA